MPKSVLYPWIFLLITLVFFTFNTIDYENKVEHLEEVIDIKTCEIDSLFIEVDSLIKKLEESNLKNQIEHYKNEFLNLLDAIIRVESSNNDDAYCESEDAVGCLQIRQTMVNDVNRILKRQGNYKRYTYEDRWDRTKSIEMFNIFIGYYNLKTNEDIARSWNGGPRGSNKEATVYYWEKVKSELEEPNV